jgi:hypothetical protein
MPSSDGLAYDPSMSMRAISLLLLIGGTAFAQAPEAASGTSTDLFVMIGSDFDRPGLVPRSNYNIGIGHTFGFLKKAVRRRADLRLHL